MNNDQRPTTTFRSCQTSEPMVPWWMSSEIRTSSHQWRLWSSIRIHHVIYIIIMIYHDISIIIIHPQSSQTYHVFFYIDFENNPNLSWKRIFQPLSGRVPLLFYQMVLCPYISSTGWWLTYPSEKYEFVKWEYYPQIYGKLKNLPNHQPDHHHIPIVAGY